MRIAFIPPVSLLGTTTWTDYQLCLPHLLLDSPAYRNRYRQLCQSPAQFVILDNGAAENERVDDYTLLAFAKEFGVDEVAIPDILGDGPATVGRMEAFFSRVEPALSVEEDREYNFGFVAQGNTLDDALRTVNYVMEGWYSPWVKTVYLPRLLIEKSGDPNVRIQLARYIHDARPRLDIHLFGMHSDHPMEVFEAATTAPFIRGVDTSMPYNFAYFREFVGYYDRKGGASRPPNYFDLPEDKFPKKILSGNLKVMKDWAAGKKPAGGGSDR